ncbi:MAG: acyl-CoA thioesterase [Leucothrix sp.]
MSEFNTQRERYFYFSRITTRWMDNDVYQHINNVNYYSFFDTVANEYLMLKGGLDIARSEVVGFIVSSSCQYLSPISHPSTIDAAFRVNKIGKSSVEYGVAVFKAEATTASAWGTYTHVFVNRETNQSTPIPDTLRHALEQVLIAAE